MAEDRDDLHAIEKELQAERAAALGRAGKRVEEALARRMARVGVVRPTTS